MPDKRMYKYRKRYRNANFCYVTLRSPVEICPCLGGTYCLHSQGRRVSQAASRVSSAQEENMIKYRLLLYCLFGLHFGFEF
jgi:hypothetical protein